MYNHTLDECGPVYLTIGDGGNIERLAIPFVDDPGGCPGADQPAPWEQPVKCVTYQVRASVETKNTSTHMKS